MNIRTVKKAVKALSDGRKTPLLSKVTLTNVCFFIKYRNYKRKRYKYKLRIVVNNESL